MNNNKEKNFVSAVLYVHNDENRIQKTLQTIIRVLEENFERSEIICVNDFSTDGSVSTIKECSKGTRTTCVSILNMSCFHGVELAMTAGTDLAIGDFVFEFDSCLFDFTDDMIMQVYNKSLEGYDIVCTVPDARSKKSSAFFYCIFNKFSGLPYKLNTERFRILSRRVINRASAMNKTIPYRKPVYAACGLKSFTIPYEPLFKASQQLDKAVKKYRQNLAADSLIIFTDTGYKACFAMTFLLMFLSVMIGIYSFTYHLLKTPVPGWTSTLLFLSVAFFFLFFILTIVIKYLQVLVNLVFHRTRYSFESIEKLSK